VNTIDLEAARARDIPVCNMPGTNSRAVAEMTLGLMLAVLRKLGALDRQLRNSGEWRSPPAWQGDLGELCGRTVGLVGFGAVPRLLAPILAAMGAEVVYTGRGAKVDVPYAYLAKEELLGKADIVSLHIPESEETYHWLDTGAVAAMKPGAVLINTARGGLVEESALLGALQSGQLAGAGLDVFASEPLAAGHALLALDNVIAAPHVAWLTRETLERSLAFAVENIRRLESGESLRNRVV
jgi:phosphoglycerate dehydrogenase-like enzyme